MYFLVDFRFRLQTPRVHVDESASLTTWFHVYFSTANEATTTTTAITQKEKEKCFSDPLVYVLIALLLILAVVTVALGILLFLARRSTSQGSQGSCDSKEWWENKRHLRESSDLAARKY